MIKIKHANSEISNCLLKDCDTRIYFKEQGNQKYFVISHFDNVGILNKIFGFIDINGNVFFDESYGKEMMTIKLTDKFTLEIE